MANATIKLPLHEGHAPAYLLNRMIKLSGAISKVIVSEYGQHELLRRISDPLWFQAFGCVLGFDWHSSGITTVVTGVLKQSLTAEEHGISIAGGKGKRSTDAKKDIPLLAEKDYNLSTTKIDGLLYASKMAAKVDNATVQDGYSLYHHVILFDKNGDWSVVQQGMNTKNMMARRYHWMSDLVKSFTCEPRTGIICNHKNPKTLNMSSINSKQNQDVCMELVTGSTENLKTYFNKINQEKNNANKSSSLDNWLTRYNSNSTSSVYFENALNSEDYEMPRRLNWDLFKEIYDMQPKNYEQLISTPGVGPAAVRALSLIGEIIFGTKASWQDPVKFTFAHGGKDGVPYPVARRTYDKSIDYLSAAIEGADILREDRINALKRLAAYSAKLFSE
ncbi:MAG TPA: DUF763 domain-containing protein [Nitrososphaeraceae archaeon]|nr:DUF763 domain-containing protein [Nitrososphaeraceae archaeon]